MSLHTSQADLAAAVATISRLHNLLTLAQRAQLRQAADGARPFCACQATGKPCADCGTETPRQSTQARLAEAQARYLEASR